MKKLYREYRLKEFAITIVGTDTTTVFAGTEEEAINEAVDYFRQQALATNYDIEVESIK